MPLIPPDMLRCVGFIYETRDKAVRDDDFLATGVIVGIPVSDESGAQFEYFVTNKHVIKDLKTIAVRFNRPDGFAVLDTDPSNWAISETDDLAATPVNCTGFEYASVLTPKTVLTRDKFTKHKIGPGDELFLISRYPRHEIKYDRNYPLMRFGNIAMNPTDQEDYFTVELRSIGGHSGSPVFVYDLPFSWPKTRDTKEEKFLWMFLGIDMGHIVEYNPLVKYDRIKKRKVENPTWIAEGNVALSQVIPAWKVDEFLQGEPFARTRKIVEESSKNNHPPDFKEDHH